MRSGLLNERLTVMRATTTKDENGAETVSLEAVGSYWCRVLHNRHDRADNDVDRVVYNPEIRFELRASVPTISLPRFFDTPVFIATFFDSCFISN